MRSEASTSVQQDWENREFTQTVQLGVTQLAAFLNEFDSTTRCRLATLNNKISKLERRMELIEATLHSVDQQ